MHAAASGTKARNLRRGNLRHISASTKYTPQNGITVGGCIRKATEPAIPGAKSQPCAISPIARSSSGTAKPRGSGSISIESTAGPAMVAPRETIPATSSEAGAESPSAAAIRYRPQIPSARVTICSLSSTSRKPRPVTRASDRAVSSYSVGPVLAQDVQNKLISLEPIDEANVELVWDPPWNQGMMTEAAQAQTGLAVRF